MREILFRGKRIDNGEWVYSQTVFSYLDNFYIPTQNLKCTVMQNLDTAGNISEIRCKDSKCFFKVQTDTVGQYTGLTDKNGKKIFEGDILEGIRYGNEVRAEVLWIDKAASWGIRYSFRKKNESGYTSWLNSAWFRLINSASAPVVIGNIHDNPELLEVGE